MIDTESMCIGIALGACGVMLTPVAAMLARSIYWGAVDAIDLLRHAEMKLGSSRWNWLWIVPLAFGKSAFETFMCEINGGRRVG